jgi:hypothetical protein
VKKCDNFGVIGLLWLFWNCPTNAVPDHYERARTTRTKDDEAKL